MRPNRPATNAGHHAVDDPGEANGKERPALAQAREVLLVAAVVLLALGYVRLDRKLNDTQQVRAVASGVVDMGSPPAPGGHAVTEPYGNRSLLSAPRPDERTVTGDRTVMTVGLAEFRETVRISELDAGLRVDALGLECHGGTATISWQIGNLEGITTNAGLTLEILFDGSPISSIIKGADGHIFQDTPMNFSAVRDCPVGDHEVALELARVDGGWGFPYVVNPGDDPATTPVLRGFVVTEVWSSERP